MRILLLSNIFPPGFIGGYELGALEMARGLASRGHEVEVLTSDFFQDDEGVLAGLPVHRVLDFAAIVRLPSHAAIWARQQGFVLPRNLRVLGSALARFRPDRVLCFNLAGLGGPGIMQYLVGLGHRPVLFLMDQMFQGLTKDAKQRAAFEAAFGKPDWLDKAHCVFMSQNLRAEFETDLGRAAARATLIQGWVDWSLISGEEPPEREAGAPTRFVFASRVAGHKGIETTLQACRLLLDQGHDGFRLDVFGDGEVRHMLQQRAAMRLQDHLHYGGTPPKEKLLPRFRDYDGLVFPTWPREPFGFVVAEAAASGCVPLMTAGIGAAEWFLDGVDSFKIRNSVDGLATAMLKLMLMPERERAAMRRRARTTAGRFFGFSQALDRLEAVLQETPPPPPPPPPAAHDIRAAESAMNVLNEVWRSGQHG